MIAYGVGLGVASGGFITAILSIGTTGSDVALWLGFTFLGALIGGAIGLALGLVLGLALLVAASGSLRASSSAEQQISGSYLRRFFRVVSVGYIALSAVAIGILLNLRLQDIGIYAVASCIPVIVATAWAGWAGNRVITWLEDQLDRSRERDVP